MWSLRTWAAASNEREPKESLIRFSAMRSILVDDFDATLEELFGHYCRGPKLSGIDR